MAFSLPAVVIAQQQQPAPRVDSSAAHNGRSRETNIKPSGAITTDSTRKRSLRAAPAASTRARVDTLAAVVERQRVELDSQRLLAAHRGDSLNRLIIDHVKDSVGRLLRLRVRRDGSLDLEGPVPTPILYIGVALAAIVVIGGIVVIILAIKDRSTEGWVFVGIGAVILVAGVATGMLIGSRASSSEANLFRQSVLYLDSIAKQAGASSVAPRGTISAINSVLTGTASVAVQHPDSTRILLDSILSHRPDRPKDAGLLTQGMVWASIIAAFLLMAGTIYLLILRARGGGGRDGFVRQLEDRLQRFEGRVEERFQRLEGRPQYRP